MRAQLLRAQSQGKISPAIFIDPEYERLKPPAANMIRREIQLQEAHLAYLWTICYLFIGVQETIHNHHNETPVVSISESPQFSKLLLALNWSKSLSSYYGAWPEDLPAPSDAEQHVQFTNELFLHTMRYLMFHELAHLLFHTASIDFRVRLNGAVTANAEEQRRLRNMEQQADDFALTCLHLSEETLAMRYMKGLGGVMAHLSTLFLISNPGGTNGHYPDADLRLKTYFNQLKLSEEPFLTYTELTVSMGLQIFLTLQGVTYMPLLRPGLSYETLGELITDLFGVIKAHKSITLSQG